MADLKLFVSRKRARAGAAVVSNLQLQLSRRLRVIPLIAVALSLASGCKELNTAFDFEPPRNDSENTNSAAEKPTNTNQSTGAEPNSSPSPDTSTVSDPDGNVSTRSDIGSTPTPDSDSDKPDNSSPNSEDLSSSTASSTGSSQDTTSGDSSGAFNYLDFCKRGAVLCYRMLETESSPEFTRDDGPEQNHLNLSNGGMTGGLYNNAPTKLFNRTMYTNATTDYKPKRPYAYGGRNIGFDLWFKPDPRETNNWTAFEIDGLLSLRRNASNKLECRAKSMGQNVAPAVADVDFEGAMFQHVSCAIENGRLQIQVDAGTIARGASNIQNKAGEFQFTAGRPMSIDPGDTAMRARFAMIRVWSDTNAMYDAIRREYPAVCNDTRDCNSASP